jgi:predicted RND superfamily exporter protein
MGGAAALLQVKINVFNFIVFPITFGIAVDYGATVAVRVSARGGDVLGALAEVGPAVALCSWTSMIGYGTLLVSSNRALRSFGWYAIVGEITSISTALVMLPALALYSGRRARARLGLTPPETETPPARAGTP